MNFSKMARLSSTLGKTDVELSKNIADSKDVQGVGTTSAQIETPGIAKELSTLQRLVPVYSTMMLLAVMNSDVATLDSKYQGAVTSRVSS